MTSRSSGSRSAGLESLVSLCLKVQAQLSQTQTQLQQNQSQMSQKEKELQQAKSHTQQVSSIVFVITSSRNMCMALLELILIG